MKAKKIGIISINAHTKVLNPASPLHSYAFQEFLSKHGYDTTIIDYKPCYYGKFNVRHPYDHYLQHPFKDEKRQAAELAKWKALYKEREARFDRFQEFIDKYYKQTPICYDQESLDKLDPGCDIYICATDIIWKYNPNTGFDRGYFLYCDTMRGKGKIAYAASRGAKKYTAEQTVMVREMLSSFDYISVREKSLFDFLKSKTNKSAALVLDPVFSHDAEFYRKLAVVPEKKGYVLIYIAMDESLWLTETAVAYARKNNLDVIELSENIEESKITDGVNHTVVYGHGVEEWLGYMQEADFIFTNSFHCCCFSIIYHKNFCAGPRVGDKVDWVMEMFGLSDYKIGPDAQMPNREIDFEKVDAILSQHREASERFILEAIKNVSFRLSHPRLAKLFLRNNKLSGLEKFLTKK